MHKILFILFLFFSTKSFADSMISLNEYMKKNEKYVGDFVTNNYVFGRCSAVFLYVAGITQNSTDNSIYNRTLDLSRYFDEINISLMQKKSNFDQEAIKNNLLRNKSSFSTNYAKDGQANYAKTGEYTGGTYIAEDITFCSNLVKNSSK